ncbi:MAG: hypothetical protein AAFY76_00890 [Cyanobacteria bacterium J06649_11]
MIDSEVVSNIKELIVKDDVEEALTLLSEHIDSIEGFEASRNTVLVLRNRLYSFNQRKNLGLTHNEEEKNEIVYSLLNLVDSLFKPSDSSKELQIDSIMHALSETEKNIWNRSKRRIGNNAFVIFLSISFITLSITLELSFGSIVIGSLVLILLIFKDEILN